MAMIQPNNRSKVSSWVEVERVTSCFVFWFRHPSANEEAPSTGGTGLPSGVSIKR